MKSNIIILGLIISLFSCETINEEEAKIEKIERQNMQYDLALKSKLTPFKPIPSSINNDENAIERLGHVLYFDKRLSENNTISCNSCHNMATFGVDNLPTSPGTEGKNGDRNSPTSWNAFYHSSQFWDGRAKDVEEQAGMPITNPVEMNIPSEQYLVNKLSNIELYQKMFTKAYPNQKNPITYQNLRNAIGKYERKFATPSRFDKYLYGETEALTLQEKKGLSSFVNIGCTTCHAGVALGGNMIQTFGKFEDYWKLTGSEHIDKGLAAQTGNDDDLYKFKVPSLRNVEMTGPYFHDGSVSDLRKAVKIMAKAQLNYEVSNEETENIVAFLKSLTGEIPENIAEEPIELKL